MYKNFITLDAIISRLGRAPIMKDLAEETALEFAVDVLGLIGNKSILQTKVIVKDISAYRTSLPSDAVDIDQVRKVDTTDTYDVPIPMRSATDNYHIGYSSQNDTYRGTLTDFTYDVRHGVIYTSFDEGQIEIAYSGLPFTENGNLLLPDDINIIKAVESYIKQEHLRPLWEIGKIPDKVMNKAEEEYCFYVAKAQTKSLNIDQRQALSSSLTRLYGNTDDRADFYKNMGLPEYIYNKRQ